MVHFNGVCHFPLRILWWIIGGAIFNWTMWKSSCHKLCTWMVSLLHGSSNGTSSLLIMRSSCHTTCTWIASLQCHSFLESWCGKAPETSMFFPSWILWWYFKSLDREKSLATLCAIEWFLSSVIPFINLHLHLVTAQSAPLLSVVIWKTIVLSIAVWGVRGARFTTYNTNPVIIRIWTGKREIRDHINNLEVPRIPKSHNTCGLLQKPGRSIPPKLLDSLL